MNSAIFVTWLVRSHCTVSLIGDSFMVGRSPDSKSRHPVHSKDSSMDAYMKLKKAGLLNRSNADVSRNAGE